MKKFALIAATLPGAAPAHGAHASVHEAAHGLAHVAPVLGGLAVIVAVGLVIAQQWRS